MQNDIESKAFQLLKEHKDVAFATVCGNKPEIRVFQVMRIEDRTLFFATAPHKRVYAQLKENPNIELLAMHGNVSVRISGKALFDVADATCRAIFNDNPVLPRLYSDYTKLVYFRMPVEALDWFDLTPTPPQQIHLTFQQN